MYFINLIKEHTIFFVIFVVIISFVIFLLILWNYPIIRSIEEPVSLSSYGNGKEVLLCTGGGNTGPAWKVLDSYGTTPNISKDIDIIGFTPDKVLKFAFYNYFTNKLIFIGTFTKDNPTVFQVEEWKFVGNIQRIDAILPYPPKSINVFELEIK